MKSLTPKFPSILACAFALTLAPVLRSADPLPAGPAMEEISPGDARLHFVGRVDWRDPAQPSMSFPGCELVARFEGTGLAVRMATTGGDRVRVIVDGKPTARLLLTQTPATYTLASDLSAGEHTVVVCKDSEAYQGTVRFYGISAPAGTKLLPVPPPRLRIEFIGDSITCGYGDLATAASEHFSGENSSWYLGHASITARALGADASTVAVSGIRLTLGPKGEASPTVYLRTHLLDRTAEWDFGKEAVPDVVVINLSTNDFGRNPPDEKTWTETYDRYLDFIRTKRPVAQIFITDGPMMPEGPALEHVRAWNRAVVTRRNAAGDARIHILSYGVQRPEDGYGADWHPNLTTQQKMADTLVAAIRTALAEPLPSR